MIGSRRNPARGKTGLPKIAAKRDFWEEEWQARRAGRQAKRAVCHGALPATSRRGFGLRVAVSLREPRQSVAADGRSRARTAAGCRAGSSPCYIPTGTQKRHEGMVGHRRNPASGKQGSRKSQRSEIFGKRSGRRSGRGGKRSAPSAMAPCRRRVGGASDASRCRFPSGASAKRRALWPLARANSRGYAAPVQALATSPPVRKKKACGDGRPPPKPLKGPPRRGSDACASSREQPRRNRATKSTSYIP